MGYLAGRGQGGATLPTWDSLISPSPLGPCTRSPPSCRQLSPQTQHGTRRQDTWVPGTSLPLGSQQSLGQACWGVGSVSYLSSKDKAPLHLPGRLVP